MHGYACAVPQEHSFGIGIGRGIAGVRPTGTTVLSQAWPQAQVWRGNGKAFVSFAGHLAMLISCCFQHTECCTLGDQGEGACKAGGRKAERMASKPGPVGAIVMPHAVVHPCLAVLVVQLSQSVTGRMPDQAGHFLVPWTSVMV